MDKSNSATKKLVKPTAPNTPRPGNSGASGSETTRNGSASSSAVSITGEIVRKLSQTTGISPINSSRPGRLPSFQAGRDLSLGGGRPGADSGAKPKKVFAPTIPARRTKTQDSTSANETKVADNAGSSRGRGRRDSAPRGRGRGNKPELIQTVGSIFGEGLADLGSKQRSGAAYAVREDTGSSAGLEKPKLSALDTKINKEEEDAALKELLRDDFIDNQDGDEFDPDLSVQPIQLPKCSFVKKETDDSDVKIEEPAVVTAVDGMTIKQEREDVKPVVAAKSYHRRLNPSEASTKDIFGSDGEILFFQLPDVLPCLKPEKEKPILKVEPGTSSQKTTQAATSSIDESSHPEGVFEDTQEGRLGTLRVHQSGKVTLQMGNHSFVIDSATQVSYLQDLVSIDVDAQEKRGTMKAIGPIKYKAICVPDWCELIEDS